MARSKATAAAAAQLDPAHLPLAWIDGCPVLTGGQAPAALREIIGKTQAAMAERFHLPLVLVVIDAMTSAGGFRDANDTSEVARVMVMLAKLARQLGLLIAIIDHFGKDVSTGTRNSSTKEDNADAVLALLGERSIEGAVANPRMAVRKIKGGAGGVVVPFRTVAVDVDGESTLLLVWSSAEEAAVVAAKAAKKWPKTLMIFMRALGRVLDDHGKRLRPFPDGPEVLAVDRDVLRFEYAKAYPADNAKAKGEAFRRSEQAAISAALVCARELEDGRTVYWRLGMRTPEEGQP
jgi:hypothetical protein